MEPLGTPQISGAVCLPGRAAVFDDLCEPILFISLACK